jgi:hypothetical protein
MWNAVRVLCLVQPVVICVSDSLTVLRRSTLPVFESNTSDVSVTARTCRIGRADDILTVSKTSGGPHKEECAFIASTCPPSIFAVAELRPK